MVPALSASDVLSSIPGVWRGLGRVRANAEPTGVPKLDDALGGGWPIGALSQIVSRTPGLGFSLITPLLARMTRGGRGVVLISPPYIPYAPALRDAGIDLEQLLWITPKDRVDGLWVSEQLLRSGVFGVVALWMPPLEAPIERRLQIAAETGRSVGLVAHCDYATAHSIAAVRLHVSTGPQSMQIEVARCRGARPGARVTLNGAELQAA